MLSYNELLDALNFQRIVGDPMGTVPRDSMTASFYHQRNAERKAREQTAGYESLPRAVVRYESFEDPRTGELLYRVVPIDA